MKAPNGTPDGIGEASGFDDPRLIAAVEEYMAAVEAGERPDRRELLLRYPEVAGKLSICLDGLALVNSAADQIAGVSASTIRRQGGNISVPPIDFSNAQVLGDFRLVREIGRGGMGVVYEAMQLSLGRRVAVKVLPLASALDARQLERFHNEAQAAARLHHTNIVPVYAVGVERSVHFYAMQLIEGHSLADVIRELRAMNVRQKPAANIQTEPAAANDPSSSAASAQTLSSLRSSRGSAYARSVARLGLQVAEALDYAHRAGIVHRDIKPANLLLDAAGRLWITDFGLAQFYSETGLTLSHDMVGTMRYMSPEQASGRAVVLDQRTDIYSLGVTLYELLTLERALPGATHEQLLDQLAHHEPRSPRSIDKTIPRELEIILTKAISKDPAERYPTAAALAEDLGRFLRDEPITARPPSMWDRAVKWARRHKSLTLSTLVMLSFVACGLLISTLLIAREQAKTKDAYKLIAREQAKTKEAYKFERQKAIEADRQGARAEHSFQQAREAVDFFSRIAVEMDGPELSDVRRQMLEESLNYYSAFVEDRGEDASVASELDAARARVALFLDEFMALDASLRASSRARLLAEDSVQKELKLTPGEIAAAREYSQDFALRPGEGPADLRRLGAQEKRQRFTARAAEVDAAITRILGPQRADRLRQIQRQIRGPLTFSDADIVQKLGLSREQRATIRQFQSQYRNARFGPGPFEGEMSQRRRAETIANILAQLIPAQNQAWTQMIGAPFTGKIFGGGGGGGFGPDHHDGGPDGPGGKHGGGPDGGPNGPGGGPGGPGGGGFGHGGPHGH